MILNWSRRSILDLSICAALAPILLSCSHRPASDRLPRIGFMIGEGYPTMEAAFFAELARLGYVVGDDLIVETRRSRDSAQLQSQAAELAAMDLDLLVAAALPQALAVRTANPNMPMVVGTAPGLVSNGFASSLDRPGGIVTGMDELPEGVTGRRLGYLHAAVPGLSRVALLSTTPGRGGHEAQLADAEEAAAELGLAVTTYRAASPAEVETALAAIASDRMDGLVNFQGGLSLGRRHAIVRFLEARRIPAIYQSRHFVEAGGLMAYAPDQDEQFRMAARYVDRILRGARPGDLPIRHPSHYYLTVSRSAAAAIGLTLSPDFLSRADFVVA